MGKVNYTEEQIAAALRRVEGGTPVAEVCRKLGVSEQTYYRWKKKYAGMGVAELRKTRQLEDENRRLKQLVADLTLDNVMLQDVLAKKGLKPAIKRERVHHLLERFAVTSRRACRQMLLGRSSWAYRSRAKDT